MADFSWVDTKAQEEEHRRLALEVLQEHYCMNCFRRLPKIDHDHDYDHDNNNGGEEEEKVCTCSQAERAGVTYAETQKKPIPSVCRVE